MADFEKTDAFTVTGWFQPRQGNDLITAEFLPATHLNFPDGEIRALQDELTRRSA